MAEPPAFMAGDPVYTGIFPEFRLYGRQARTDLLRQHCLLRIPDPDQNAGVEKSETPGSARIQDGRRVDLLNQV